MPHLAKYGQQLPFFLSFPQLSPTCPAPSSSHSFAILLPKLSLPSLCQGSFKLSCITPHSFQSQIQTPQQTYPFLISPNVFSITPTVRTSPARSYYSSSFPQGSGCAPLLCLYNIWSSINKNPGCWDMRNTTSLRPAWDRVNFFLLSMCRGTGLQSQHLRA